jgi:Dolichyl-phosphate-mannose-protein mannosyltransferase
MSEEKPPFNEPSVLDWVKSKLSFGRGLRVEIPSEDNGGIQPQPDSAVALQPEAQSHFPWISLAVLALCLIAQYFLEPPRASAITGIVFYVAALGLLLLAVLRREWVLPALPEAPIANDPQTFHRTAFLIALPLAVLAFLLFSGNLFTVENLTLWLIALGLLVASLWVRAPNSPSGWQRFSGFITRQNWQIPINRWRLLLFAAALLVIFFRVHQIQQTPAEPFSDHAEKLLDVFDVSQGQTHIFFPRNTGREAIQMYWTLLISWIFGTGISFLSLKIGTVLLGLLTLPYIYLLGKEIANRRVGLLAFFLAGIGYWPNVISRIGLRFPLYPLFVAPLIFHLIRGLRTGQRNQFILAGIFLGLGLHGYTPYRIVPLLVVLAVFLYLLHAQSRGTRRDALVWLLIVGVISFIVFLPLFRYATEHPDLFMYRALSRLGASDQPLPGPWVLIFLSNLWNAIRMFNWDDGNIWVISLPHRPALDIVSGALFLIGIVLLLVRYSQRRNWLDAFLLLSIPVLLLPSILSLAFPDENPAMNRTAGAIIPVFIIVALALDSLISAFGSAKGRRVLVSGLIGLLLLVSASQNFDLVFRQFDQNFRLGAWNSSEMGAVIKEFGLVYGETDTTWVVPFPYWVDTRLPGVWAGVPNRDFAIFPEHFADTLQLTGPKLFILKAGLQDPSANDQKDVDALEQLYPQGTLSLHRSPVLGHDFWIYFVPAPSGP